MEPIRATITAVGHFLPDDKLTNFDLEKMVDTNDEWIRTRTGIKERRILKDPEKATSYMAAEAAREALSEAGVQPEEVDLIIVATVTPDYIFPSTACLVQHVPVLYMLLLMVPHLLKVVDIKRFWSLEPIKCLPL